MIRFRDEPAEKKNLQVSEDDVSLKQKLMMMKKLPDLHRQAFKYKNTKKLQHDGGRAWIKDSQLFESRKDANGKLITVEKGTD